MVAPALAASAIFPDAALPHATGVVVPEAPPTKQGLKVEYVAALMPLVVELAAVLPKQEVVFGSEVMRDRPVFEATALWPRL